MAVMLVHEMLKSATDVGEVRFRLVAKEGGLPFPDFVSRRDHQLVLGPDGRWRMARIGSDGETDVVWRARVSLGYYVVVNDED